MPALLIFLFFIAAGYIGWAIGNRGYLDRNIEEYYARNGYRPKVQAALYYYAMEDPEKFEQVTGVAVPDSFTTDDIVSIIKDFAKEQHWVYIDPEDMLQDPQFLKYAGAPKKEIYKAALAQNERFRRLMK